MTLLVGGRGAHKIISSSNNNKQLDSTFAMNNSFTDCRHHSGEFAYLCGGLCGFPSQRFEFDDIATCAATGTPSRDVGSYAVVSKSVAPKSDASSAPRLDFLSKYQVAVPDVISCLKSNADPKCLPAGYEPGEYDVVSGRGKGFYKRKGNRIFRQHVSELAPQYLAARTKLDKTTILAAVVDRVKSHREGKCASKFVRRANGNRWYELSDEEAREKAGHAMRDAVLELQARMEEEDEHRQAMNDKREQPDESWRDFAEAAFRN